MTAEFGGYFADLSEPEHALSEESGFYLAALVLNTASLVESYHTTMAQGTHIDVDTLSSALRKFAQQVLTDAEEWRESSKLTKVRRGFFIRPNLSLQYIRDPGMRYEKEAERIEDDEWDPKGIVALWEQRIRPSTAVSDLLTEDIRADTLLRNFSHRLVADWLGSGAPAIDKYVGILIRDLRQEPQKTQARLWLDGIEVPDEAVVVSKDLAFRRPRLEDLLERVHDDAIHYVHAFQTKIRFSCILELQGAVSNPGELQHRAEQIVSALRLFRVGSVRAARIDFSAESFTIFGLGSSLFSPGGNARNYYALSRRTSQSWRDFLRS